MLAYEIIITDCNKCAGRQRQAAEREGKDNENGKTGQK